MAETMTFDRPLKLTVVQCCACGVEYAIPQELHDKLLEKREKGTTYCPNGHSWHFVGKSCEARIRDAERRANEAERIMREMRGASRVGSTSECPKCHQLFSPRGLGIHRSRRGHW